jgi:regulator of nucleoside diphosphate kinase
MEGTMHTATLAVPETHGTIYVTTSVSARLQDLIAHYRAQGRSDDNLDRLEEELDRATPVSDEQLPPDVVTLGSRVRLKDLHAGEERRFTLVLPSRANVDEGRMSILAPLGTAVLGFRAGDEVLWEVPAGPRLLRVEEVAPPAERV